MFAIARKALTDLATTSLEERMGEVFTQPPAAMDEKTKAGLGDGAQDGASTPAVVRSAFDLPAEQRAAIQNALNETFSADIHVRFETAPDLIGGIELTANGQKVAWSIADYLASLEQGVDELLIEAPRLRPKPSSRPVTRAMNVPESLQDVFDRAFAGIGQVRGRLHAAADAARGGHDHRVSTGIATVSGLPGVGFEELVGFPGELFGIAFNVDEDEIGVVLLGDYWHLHAGDEVERTGRVMDVAVGDGLLGRVIDPLGRPLDGNGPVAAGERLPIERPAPPIMDRAPVTVPLQTGLKVIDALIPIGRGQRELILGDRQTGKTAIAIDTILNQRGQNVVCVYCAIGQRASAVAKAVADLRDKGAMEYTVVVVTEGNDPPGLAYIAPYAATSIAEHFMEAGRDVLIVYDDLTHHARAYRELSLLLRRPPGREAFPGDIFYIHSRLLERATHLRKELGGGSLTALPIIETEAQDISAYIPTNLISITDGQIYLSPSLFELGVLPAVDVGKSVSRVGGKAQRAAYRAVAGDLKLAYAQFEELETFCPLRRPPGRRHAQEHRARTADPRLPQAAGIRAGVRARADRRPPGADREAVRHRSARPDGRRRARRARGGGEAFPQRCARDSTPPTRLSDDDRKAIVETARNALEPFSARRNPRPLPHCRPPAA